MLSKKANLLITCSVPSLPMSVGCVSGSLCYVPVKVARLSLGFGEGSSLLVIHTIFVAK